VKVEKAFDVGESVSSADLTGHTLAIGTSSGLVGVFDTIKCTFTRLK